MTAPRDMGARLRRLRTAKGWTQEELAKRARVARITIARIEGRARRRRSERPALRTVEKLARALEVAVGELLE